MKRHWKHNEDIHKCFYFLSQGFLFYFLLCHLFSNFSYLTFQKPNCFFKNNYFLLLLRKFIWIAGNQVFVAAVFNKFSEFLEWGAFAQVGCLLVHVLMFSFVLEPVMSEYHKMDTNKYPNIFRCQSTDRTNIRIYSDAT